MNPFTQALGLQNQFWDNAAETLEKTQVAPERLETMENVEVGQTPSEAVYRENKLELLHYDPLTEEQHDVPILIVYALINKPYILDLQPDRSVVRRLLEEGFDVYLIDWGEPSRLDSSLTLHDYVNRYIDNCVDVVRERSGQDSINVLGYCMGGTMSAMYAALHPEKVRNLGLMAAGLCFEETGGVLELWGGEDYYSPEAITEAFGNAPGDFLDLGFSLMNPVENNLTKYVRLYDNLEDEDFVENFARMEKWLGDEVDVAGDTFAEFIRKIYQENQLYRNELEINGEKVDLENIDMPVLQILGEYDHLIPPESSKPFNDVIASEDTEVYQHRTGHIGLSVSGSSHEKLWPDVAEWFRERSNGSREEGNGRMEGEEVEVEDVGGDPVESLEGIGPTYSERLAAAGITSVGDLAESDAAEVADAAEVSEERAGEWIERAGGR